MQVIRGGLGRINRGLVVHQIPIHVMLQNKTARVKPVIEDLTPHDMPTHAPTILILFLGQPVVSQHLNIEIEHLKGGMMDVKFRTFEEEKAVVVNPLTAAIEVQEGDNVGLCFRIMYKFSGLEVEIRGIEFEGFVVIRMA